MSEEIKTSRAKKKKIKNSDTWLSPDSYMKGYDKSDIFYVDIFLQIVFFHTLLPK